MVGEPPRRGHPFLARRLQAEPGFRRRIETAVELGIPPSQLDGREPAAVTEYEYDDAGRVVRTVTTSEPRWTDQDRAEVLALGEYRDGLCHLCGRPLEVCTSHEDTGPQFTAKVSAVCRVTLAKLEQTRAMTDGGKKALPNAPAYLWAVTESG